MVRPSTFGIWLRTFSPTIGCRFTTGMLPPCLRRASVSPKVNVLAEGGSMRPMSVTEGGNMKGKNNGAWADRYVLWVSLARTTRSSKKQRSPPWCWDALLPLDWLLRDKTLAAHLSKAESAASGCCASVVHCDKRIP